MPVLVPLKEPYTKNFFFEKGKIHFLDLFAKAIGGPCCMTFPGKIHRHDQAPQTGCWQQTKNHSARLPWGIHEFITYLQEHRWLRQLHHPRVHAGMGVMGVRQFSKSGSFEFRVQFARPSGKCLFSTLLIQLIGSVLLVNFLSFLWISLASLASLCSSRRKFVRKLLLHSPEVRTGICPCFSHSSLFLEEIFSKRNSVPIFYCRVLSD